MENEELRKQVEASNTSQMENQVQEVNNSHLDELQEQISLLQEENQRLKQENDMLNTRVKEMEETIQSGESIEVQSVAQIQRLGEECQQLKGELEKLKSDHLWEMEKLRKEMEAERQSHLEEMENSRIQQTILDKQNLSLQQELEQTQQLLEQAQQSQQQQDGMSTHIVYNDAATTSSKERLSDRLEFITEVYNNLDSRIGAELQKVCAIDNEKLQVMPGVERFELLMNTLTNGVQYDQQLVDMVIGYLCVLVGNVAEDEYNDFNRIKIMFETVCSRQRHLSSLYQEKQHQLQEMTTAYDQLADMTTQYLTQLVGMPAKQEQNVYKQIEGMFESACGRNRHLNSLYMEMETKLKEAEEVKAGIARIAYNIRVIQDESSIRSWGDVLTRLPQWERLMNTELQQVAIVNEKLRRRLEKEEAERRKCQKELRELRELQKVNFTWQA